MRKDHKALCRGRVAVTLLPRAENAWPYFPVLHISTLLTRCFLLGVHPTDVCLYVPRDLYKNSSSHDYFLKPQTGSKSNSINYKIHKLWYSHTLGCYMAKSMKELQLRTGLDWFHRNIEQKKYSKECIQFHSCLHEAQKRQNESLGIHTSVIKI